MLQNIHELQQASEIILR